MLRLSRKLGGAALMVVVAAGSARAELQLQAGGGYRYEDNLFRLPSGQTSIDGVKRSDRVASVNAQIDADFHPGDFDGTLTGNAAQNWYARNSILNNFGYSLGLNVQRRPGATIGLSVNAESDRRLSSFTDLNTRIRNIQSLQILNAVATFPITPELRIVATPEYQRSTNSSSRINFNDYNRYGSGVGLGYYSAIGNSIAVTVTRRHTAGIRDRFASINGSLVNAKVDVDDTSVDLRINYKPTTFTSISSIISYVNRNDKSVLNNNYHGPSGDLTFVYSPRDTLRAQVSVGRMLDTQSFLFVDSVRDDYVRGSLDTIVLDNLQLGARAEFDRRKFQFDPLSGTSNRIERVSRFTGSASYLVLNRVQLSLVGFHEHRSANYEFGNYSANVIQATATFVFGKRGTIFNGQSGIR